MSWPPTSRDPSATRDGASSSAIWLRWSRQSPITSSVLLQAANGEEPEAGATSPVGPWYRPQVLGIVLIPACVCHGYGKWTHQSSRVFKRDLQTLPPDQATEESYQSVACIALLTSQPSSLHSPLEIFSSPPFAFPLVYERALVRFFQLLSFPQRQHCFSLAFVSKVCSASWILWLRLTDLKWDLLNDDSKGK